ncbi:uncharacterized protein EAF02_001367 [Botrytis sinoallii]|uniref:uncharacterized protein n=1 Tax=Botrytis sinoallii TaxID=1463999 RepID=UPI0019011059|nr:uncharacterized protein EAF02_001367 [Botrytis sinoallii]KAF7891042.1 hypothetical protein EAF02_001367 [Botrytis sinoallii]
MPHHLSSFFKSVGSVTENAWESATNNLSNSPKRNRERGLTVRQSFQQVQPRRLFPAVRPAPVPTSATATADQPIGLGLGLGMEVGFESADHEHEQVGIPSGVENQNPNTSSAAMVDTIHTTHTSTTNKIASNTTIPPPSTSALTKTSSKNTQRSANSKETSTSKSGNSYNPLVTTSSTYTNPSENLPPTPNLRAVEVGKFGDVVGGGTAAIGGGDDSAGGSASHSQSETISPVDGMGMFGPISNPIPGSGFVSSGGGAASAGGNATIAHERSERHGSINMQTPIVTASGTRVHNYRGVDHGAVVIPGSALASASGSGINTPRLIAAGIGASGLATRGRERAFTIPRKPVPMTIVVGNTGLEVIPYGRPIEDIGTGACIVNRQECMDWKNQFDERGRGQDGDEKDGEDGEGEEVGESEEERKERLEKERKEREKRDLLHENPLLSHPVESTTIATGTPPTVSPTYIASTSLSSKRRGFRRSWTAPINGFNFTSLGGIGVMGFGNSNPDPNMHGGLGDTGMGTGMGINQRGTARDRYSGNSSEGMGMGMGSRRGSFLRRASVSFKGMGLGMQGLLRGASGGSGAFAGAGAGTAAVERMGLSMDHTREGGGAAGSGRPVTMHSEYRGVGGYVGDDAMALARERVAEAENQRRRSHRQSMVLPKFEWEEEFATAEEDEGDA